MENVFIHELSDVQSDSIGRGTKIWQFSVVLPGAKIGKNCNICAQTFIENDVIIGDNVTVKCGVQLWDGIRIGNNVFIASNTTFTNDIRPSKLNTTWKCLPTNIEDNVTIGANATILPGLRLGKGCFIGAGAVVTHDVPAGATVIGNPARIMEGKK